MYGPNVPGRNAYTRAGNLLACLERNMVPVGLARQFAENIASFWPAQASNAQHRYVLTHNNW